MISPSSIGYRHTSVRSRERLVLVEIWPPTPNSASTAHRAARQPYRHVVELMIGQSLPTDYRPGVFQLKNHFKVVKEVARHLLRRPVVGIVAAAKTSDGRWVLIRRADTGQWALPGGTLEWGETLRSAIVRELAEETGIEQVTLGEIVGVYSAPGRDERFHAVTVVVTANVGEPVRPPMNPVEIVEVGLFAEEALPPTLAYGMGAMLDDARHGRQYWE